MNSKKRRAVWRLSGDIRGEGASILLRLWEALGWPEAVSINAGSLTRYGVSLFSLCRRPLQVTLVWVGLPRFTKHPSWPRRQSLPQ